MSNGPVEIGEWRVHGDLHRIERAGEVVRLEPKVMAVLLHLAARAGQVVSRDELMQAVWPGVVVGDNALTQVVNKLRSGLGDAAKHPRYIEAVAKKGYRLIAPVAACPSPPRASAEPAAAPAPRLGRPVLAVALVAISATAAALGTWWGGSVLRPAPALRRAEAAEARPLLVVRPVEATQAEGAAAARALSAELATTLAKVEGLTVARMPPAGKPYYALEGQLQQHGGRLRLHVNVVDSRSGVQVWAARMEPAADEAFAMQENLAQRVAAELPGRLVEAETRRQAERSTRSLEAYRLFTAARSALQARRPAENERARALYWSAIRHDPAFARAYAGLAMSEALPFQQGWSDDAGALQRAQRFASTAAALRPDLPEAHWTLAFVAVQRREAAAALAHLADALRLDPSYADAYALRGGLYTYVGQPDRGLEDLQRALRLNPDAGSLYLLLLGRAWFFIGDLEQARFQLERALERNADNVEARLYLAAAAARQGDREAAQWQMTEVLQREPAFDLDRWLAHYPLVDEGLRGRLRAALSGTSGAPPR